MGYRLVPQFPDATMHRKVMHVNLLIIFAGPRFVETQKFCYHGNVTYRLLIPTLFREVSVG